MTDTGDRGPDDERPTPPVPVVPLPPGYEVVGRLGMGGFATVWLAEQGHLGRRVAVKVLGGAVGDAETERRFMAECRAIGRLSGHPAVVTVHDAGTTADGRPYLVMEHLPGGSLQDRLSATGPLSWPEALDVAVVVADALDAAHSAGILHRDVKPANVLLDAHGRPKLGDFGIARLSEGTRTATGLLAGTIPFTPPEVLSGVQPGPTADVWALGATVHALLSGVGPFHGGPDEAPAATIARVLRSEPPSLPPTVAVGLAEFVRRCLDPDPAARPASAAAAVAELQRIQATHGLPVTAATATRSPAPATPTPTPTPTPPPTPPPTPAPATPTATPAPVAATPPTLAMAPPTHSAPGHAAPTVVDPPIGTPPGGTPGDPSIGTAPPPRRRRALVLAVIAVVVLVALAVGVVLVTRGDDSRGGDPTTTVAPTEPDAPPTVTGIDGLPVAAPAAAEAPPVETWRLPLSCTAGCVADGTAEQSVVATSEGAVVAVDPNAGSAGAAPRWTASIDPGAGQVRVDVLDHVVLVSALDADTGERVHTAFDPDDGSQRWQATVPDLVGAHPVADDEPGTVVFRGSDPDDRTPDGLDAGSTHVVDAATGQLRWWVRGHVAGVTDELVVVSDGTAIQARDRSRGTVRWVAEVATGAMVATQGVPRSALIDGVVVAVTDGTAVGLDVADGEERWRLDLPPGSRPSDTAGGVVAVPARDGDPGVVVVSGPGGHTGVTADGDERWSSNGNPPITDEPVALWIGDGDSFLVAHPDGTVARYSTDDGSRAASAAVAGATADTPWSALDGQVLTVDADGVVALDANDLEPGWSTGGPVQALVAAPEGYVAATPDALVRFRSPG